MAKHRFVQINSASKSLVERNSYFLLSLAILFLLLCNSANAQVNGTSSPQHMDTGGKADQTLKSLAKVNPSTLAMEMSLPLMTYPGRDGNSLSVGFSYSSKIWRMEATQPWFQMVNTHRVYITDIFARYSEKKASGWSSTLAPPRFEEKIQMYNSDGQPYTTPIDEAAANTLWDQILEEFLTNSSLEHGYDCQGLVCCTTYWCMPNENSGYTCTCTRWSINGSGGGGGGGGGGDPPSTPTPLYFVRTVQVTMPDGSETEFRKDDIPTSCGTTTTGCVITGNGNGTYLSVDGSGMRLFRDSSGAVLYLGNGGRFVFPSESPNQYIGDFATKYTDIDGNVSTFSSTTDEETRQTTNQWRDTLGREIVDPMQVNVDVQRQSAGTREIDLPGFDGASQHYKVKWELLKPLGCEESNVPDCVGANHETGALEDQSQKLFYDTRFLCRGNTYTDLLAYPSNPNHPDNEVLFPLMENGVRPCHSFGLLRDGDGNPVKENGFAVPVATRFNPVVLSVVELPNGKKYEFKYNRFGEISKITYPSGSYETFVYARIDPVAGTDHPAYDQTNRGVVERSVYSKTGSNYLLEQHWNYSAGFAGQPYYKVTATAPTGASADGNGIRTEKYLYPAGSVGGNFGFDSPLGGMPYEERTYAENSYSIPRTRTLTEWVTNGSAPRDPRVKRSVSIFIENGQALATLNETEYETPGENGSTAPTDPEYFAHLNVKRTKSHHFRNIPLSLAQNGSIALIMGYFSSSTVATIGETDYTFSADYKARGINSLPAESRVLDKDGNVVSKTQTVFDEPTYLVANSGSLSGNLITTWTSPLTDQTIPANSRALRGKPTTSKLWNSDLNTWIQTHVQYDQYGNRRKAWEINEDSISNRFTETEYSTDYGFAYPTKVIIPAPDPTDTHGTNQGSFATTTYDFQTGLPVTVSNEFGQTTKSEYNDPLLRPTKVYGLGDYVIPIAETIYNYDDLTVKVRKQLDATNWDEATSYMDSLGRTVKTVATDSQGDVIVETHYDFLSRVDRVTNPYRANEITTTNPILWSKTRYDVAGRAIETYAPALETQTGASLGTTSYDISTAPGLMGMAVTTTDAALKKSRSITNALGQLIVVEEPDNAGNIPALPQSTPVPSPSPTPTPTPHGQCISPVCPENLIAGEYPSYATYYEYNAQGKMVKAQQGVQFRYFKYDSLGRLIRVRQPEQEINTSLNLSDSYNTSGEWTAGFTYDDVGNILTATDAKGTLVTNAYDKANRVVTRSYSNEPSGVTTPTVNFYYDGKGLEQLQSPNYAKGKATKVTSSVSETRYTIFDSFGRLKETQQITDGNTYTSKYTYNLTGALVEEEYPSGRKVKNEFESDGDLANVTSKKTGSDPYKLFVSNFSYTSSGGISQMKLGNGRWETAKFNTRLQVTELGLGSSATDAGIWKNNYEYGELDANGNTDVSKNTGNISKQILTVPGTNFVQAYKYDSLYRITEAKESTGTSTTPNWIQQFGYDRYGNRTGFEQNIGSVSNNATPTIDVNTNRFTNLTDFAYDKNGNITRDKTVSSQSRTFVFNGDNKQTQVKDANGNPVGTYYYDGEGRRIKKVTDSDTTIFVYSSGKLIAEYSTATPASNPGVNYTTTDHLGSPRVITDATGQVKSRRDFMPFGEEITTGIGNRSASINYGSTTDSIRQKFTGYQKDNETQLDFAEARMYENRFGRFTTVDPLLASGKSVNPQTFNRYVYVAGNPLKNIDPKGTDIIVTISNRPVGTAKIRLIQPNEKSDPDIPAEVEVKLYLLTVRDDATNEISKYLVTRDSPNLNQQVPVNQGGGKYWLSIPGLVDVKTKIAVPKTINIINYAFEPPQTTAYVMVRLSDYPKGTNLPAYAVQNPSAWYRKGKLDAVPNGSPERTDQNVASGVLLHVGGVYDNGRRITGSYGCFTFSGGEQFIKDFDRDIQSRVDANYRADKGTRIWLHIQKRNDVEWKWKVTSDGKEHRPPASFTPRN